jgi:molybdate transport system substrate-binding protein
MKRGYFFSAALLCFLSLFAPYVQTASADQELIVSAAASLTNAFGEIGKKFEAANPGVRAVLNFAASGNLLQQIANGAPVDVFASADEKTMDQAKEKNLILPDTRKDFASNELVLITPISSGIPIVTLKDLNKKEVGKIALGNPDTVPAGRYAKEVLTNEGSWQELVPKFIFGDSVRQVLDYVSRAEVEAGFVFSTDAAVAKDRVKVALEAKNHKPIIYPIAVVSSTKKKDLAERFVSFVLDKESRAILSKYGFETP